MTARPKLKKADEHDAVSKRWRRWLCYMKRPGVVSAIKTRINRRERRQERENLRREFEAIVDNGKGRSNERD